MKNHSFFVFTVLAVALMPLHAASFPEPEEPAAGGATLSPHPHFRWKRKEDVKIDQVHRVQVARDDTSAKIVCDDCLEVISRFVSVRPLQPSKYWWRVCRGDGGWSQAIAFEVSAPETVFSIRAGSDAHVIVEAGA